MASDDGGFISNTIAILALIGGFVMVAFAAIRALISAGRDAREAKDLSSHHSREIHLLQEWRAGSEERNRAITASLERIEAALLRLQSRGVPR